MDRNTICARALIWGVVIMLAAPPGVLAQSDGGAPPPVSNENNGAYSKAELDQMLAPVAHYPDSLLAQVLIAATYPDQVAEANQWVKDHPDLKGYELNSALDTMNWDLSVKALVAFPQVLGMMVQHMDWTTNLGEAFLARQKEVLASIQELRHKRYAKGNLKTAEYNLNSQQGSTHSQLKTSHKTQIAKKYSRQHYRRHYALHRDYYHGSGLSIDTPFFNINIP